MLRAEKPRFPLRIFITSRKVPNMMQLARSLETTAIVNMLEIPEANSMDDIQRYIASRTDSLAVDSEADKKELVDTMLHRSNACFLWVRLVLDELESVYSIQNMFQVLQDIPNGMMSYYERIIGSMLANRLEIHSR
jgi:hypothetical protein